MHFGRKRADWLSKSRDQAASDRNSYSYTHSEPDTYSYIYPDAYGYIATLSNTSA
jgi:hypothetical protein